MDSHLFCRRWKERAWGGDTAGIWLGLSLRPIHELALLMVHNAQFLIYPGKTLLTSEQTTRAMDP